jgi:hypothetical protein
LEPTKSPKGLKAAGTVGTMMMHGQAGAHKLSTSFIKQWDQWWSQDTTRANQQAQIDGIMWGDSFDSEVKV